MLMDRQRSFFHLTIWCLLSLWLFFGCLELAELVNLVPEASAEDQEEQDLDQAALYQLARGLKPDVPNLGVPCWASLCAVAAEAPCAFSLRTVHQFKPLMVHGPPFLRLHQQHSVYRI